MKEIYLNDKLITQQEYADILRKKYAQNPPEGYTSREIKKMNDEDILDMDYFLNEHLFW